MVYGNIEVYQTNEDTMTFIIALYVLNVRAVILHWSKYSLGHHDENKLAQYRAIYSQPNFDVRLEINPVMTDDIINSRDYQDHLENQRQSIIRDAELEAENRVKQEAINDPVFTKALEGIERSATEPVEITIFKLKDWEK
jgi:hypothetical protein